ncbi:dipeptidase [Paracoccus aminophilus]|uniref:Membrane dipeptidase n=1 Tax=Paracoccus aminophilus JCM 7686 TaxID=1367847 RepID=S5YT77_PARAH|nr:membrane dipeptidase [Paracoccus aminophilus]AGT08431.1 membrane dipeptidase [Paracoccus aminophilus JCM 7686]
MKIIGRFVLILLLLVLLAAAAVVIWGPALVERSRNVVTAPDGTWPVSPEAEELHKHLIIGDLHADSLLWDRDLLDRASYGHVDVPRLIAGNVAVQVFATVTKSPRGQNYDHNSASAPDNITPLVIGQLRPPQTWFSLRARALDQAARLNAYAAAAPDELRVIRSRADLQALLAARAQGAKTVGAILASEGGHPLEGQIENLRLMYDAGFRIIGVTHFFDNELGGSLHGEGGAGAGAGLTPFGREVISEMADRDMIVDLAHASPQVVRDVLAMPHVTPILSHTGIHSQCGSHRNIDDALLQGIAQKGGIVGIGYWADVNCGRRPADIAHSIAAAIRLLGEDHVALGSDFDGSVDAPFDAAHLDVLTQALLDEGLSDNQIAKVMGGNMMAFLIGHLPQ